MRMKMRQETAEVFYVEDHNPFLEKKDFEQLIDFAFKSNRKRARYCTHKNKESQLQDMFEVFTNQTYMRPLKQVNKTYSFHIIQGCVDVYLFSDTGEVTDMISLGDFRSGKNFYFRPPENTYRSFITRTNFVIYHEATTGPFRKEDTVFAPWAPAEGDSKGIADFLLKLKEEIKI